MRETIVGKPYLIVKETVIRKGDLMRADRCEMSHSGGIDIKRSDAGGVFFFRKSIEDLLLI
jgi:hypothetical protein